MINKSLYIFVSKMFGYGIRLVLPYFLVRLLTQADFGAYRQFFLLEMYIGSLFALGLNQALYYFIPRDEANSGAYFLNTVLMNLIVFTTAFTFIGIFSTQLSHWLNMAILHDALWKLAVNGVLLVLAVACDCYLVARQRVKAAAVFEIVGQVLVSISCVSVAFATRSVQAILIGLAAARAAQLVSMMVYIHLKLNGLKAQHYFRGVREQIRYGVVLGAGGTLFTLMMRLHEFYVSRYFGTENYAIYSAGCTDLPFIQMFVQSLSVVALGQFALMEKEQDWEGIRKLWHRVLTSSYAVALPVVAFLLLVSKPLILFMFTDKYAAAVPIFQINTVAKIGLVFNSSLVLRAVRRNDMSMWANAVGLVMSPVLLYAGMKLGGMVGIVIAQAVIVVGCRLIGNVFMNRILERPLPYFVSVRDLFAFYRESWSKVRSMWMARRAGAPAAPGRTGDG